MKQQNTAVRIGEIDFWKFTFAILIVTLHSAYLPGAGEDTYFRGGSIGVEFFFVVSGFFMAKNAEKVDGYQSLADETWRFLLKRVKTFFPYMCMSCVAALIAKTLFYHGGLLKLIKNGVAGLSEVLLLKATGFGDTFFNNPTWYLSAMVCSMAVLYPLILKYRKIFTRIACPLLAFFLLGYLQQTYGQFRNPDLWDGLFRKGTIRGFAEIAFGVVCYEICSWISTYDFTKLSKLLFTVAEYGSLLAIILYSNTKSCWDMDSPSVLLMGGAVVIAAGNLSLLSGFWNRFCLTAWMGRFSLMLYLNHIYWVWIFAILGLDMEYSKMFWLYMGAAVISALLCWKFTDLIIFWYQKNKPALKSMFIQTE